MVGAVCASWSRPMKTTSLLVFALLAGCASKLAESPHTPAVAVAAPAAPIISTTELAGSRARLIGWLHDYREAGVFPSDAMGHPISVFVDDRGVRCPMAELLHKTGRDDLVEAVHREANAVRLADVREGPLHDWMLTSGLTGEEISLVQGAMNIDYGWMQDQEQTLQLAQANAEVRGKLETAEMALRDNTAVSLGVVMTRLPAHAPGPITGRVVPLSAVPPVVATAELRMQAIRPRFRVR